ncbi:MAG: DUF488 domain-containing protein [Euryarchaeota archaeon]|nr:DUF488 domain-containing protein [Euryarchaeota archaeon]MBU4607352.1 DUF488 domain-containing protein [Euryarchaeota archaeon]MBV1729834.1 DUF488 domain-containing protein [Methanobacterium sp.]MBV1754018.1 DUF488 domain-containing protein [Methanobacterium sp.]
MKPVHTLGHSNHDLQKFLKLLHDNQVQLVVDVRSSPYSKYVPHFNRENLKDFLKKCDIDYIFLGDKIGGKPKDQSYYTEGKVNYNLIARSALYKEGILKLMELSSQTSLALLCSEEDPYHCHRHNLITPKLLEKGVKVKHIRGNGKVEKITWLRKKDEQTTLF